MSEYAALSAVENLRAKLRQLEGNGRADPGVLPFGLSEIDERLPGGGLGFGSLHEVAGGGNGALHGAAAALFAAGVMARTTGKVLWCMTQADLFAPALSRVGLSLDRVIFLDAGDEKTVLSCFEEGLRHGGVVGVVAEVAKLSMSSSRRLQLAAEESGAIGVAIRRWKSSSDATDFGQPTAARTRWRVTALPSVPLPVPGVGRPRWLLELIRCRAGDCADFEVEACDEKGHLALPANVADRSATSADGRLRAAS